MGIRGRSSTDRWGALKKKEKMEKERKGKGRREGSWAYREQSPHTELELSEEVLSLTLSCVSNTL